jgi:hypothetical protein
MKEPTIRGANKMKSRKRTQAQLITLVLAACMAIMSLAQFAIELQLEPAKHEREHFVMIWEDGSFQVGDVVGCFPGQLCQN